MENERKFADYDERLIKSSKVIVWTILSVTVLTVIMSHLQPSSIVADSETIQMVASIAAIVSAIAAIILAYTRIFNPRKTAWILVGEVMFIYLVADLTNSNAFFAFISYTLVFALYLFYDKKMMRIPTIFIGSVACITRLVDIFSGTATFEPIAGILFNLCFAITAFTVSVISEKYNSDIFGTLEDQKDVQAATMKNLEEILAVVKEGSKAVTDQLRELETTSTQIAESVEHVAEGTKVTSESVENQTLMTANIKKLIEDTESRAKAIVEITGTVQSAVIDGNRFADGLTEISGEISTTNDSVTAAMNSLRERTAAMQSVVDTIASISGRTTLLALNASIEAARAGDQGRSFAVVADQIRDLSEQTKESTENIRKLILELDNEAGNASDAVTSSIENAEKQKEMVAEVNHRFDSIEAEMSNLGSEVGGITETIDSLVTSNQNIVDEISQLSAIAEEVMASTEEVLVNVTKNKDNVRVAESSMNEVCETANRI